MKILQGENAMNEITVFNSEEFGQVRTIVDGDRVLFCASDVAKALGYSNYNDAVNKHCRAIVKRDTPISGKIQAINFIPEGDIYRLIIRSKLPTAERFESWVFDEVLPSIRKNGYYQIPQQNNEAELLNAKARIADIWLRIADRVRIPEYKDVITSYATKELAGKFVLPLPEIEETTYSATEIGKELGISANKVGHLAKANNLKTKEYGKWVVDKSRYSNKQVESFRYYHKAVDVMRGLLNQ